MIRTQTLQKVNPQVRGYFKDTKNENLNVIAIVYLELPCEFPIHLRHTHT